MTFELGIFIKLVAACSGIITAAVMVFYAFAAFVRHLIWKKEAPSKCSMVKAGIRCWNDGQRQMAKELTKGINDSLLEMAKKLGDL